MALNIRKIFQEMDIDLEEERDRSAGHTHGHTRHHLDDGRVVDIEWEARDLHGDFMAYTPDLQDMMVKVFADNVPEPGDDVIVESESENKKRRGATIIRLKPGKSGNIRLRITL